MISTVKKWIGVAVGFFGLAFASVALADITLTNPLGTNSFQTVLNNVDSFLLVIAAPICGIMVVWGGFQMITSSGDPEKFSSGRKTLLYAAVGFVVVIFATSVVPLIQSIFNGS
jgi:hypothetical protein